MFPVCSARQDNVSERGQKSMEQSWIDAAAGASI